MKLTRKTTKASYSNRIKEIQPKPAYVSNAVKAFLIGGLICLFGEWIITLYQDFFAISEKEAANLTTATLILLASLLTGLGLYSPLGQFAGAGSLVPVTGFANALTSAALEHKSEGVVLGIATNMFKIAGPVIVFGVVAAYIVGLVRYMVLQLI